jgi:hypothetical protein
MGNGFPKVAMRIASWSNLAICQTRKDR